jgi:threonine dehydratase
MIELAEVEAAARRIAPHVRRTPLFDLGPLPGGEAGARLLLKLENLQVTGSFKARGATNKVLSLPAAQLARGLVTASGGNHGLGVAFAGRLAGVPATIYLPANVPPSKAEKLQRWGAKVVWEGEIWDEANAAALAAAEREGMTYLHPFADPEVMAGQGTLALEALDDEPEIDLFVAAIGGGGLIGGVATAVKGRSPGTRPGTRMIGVEAAGAPKLHRSLREGRLVELAAVTTVAHTLASRGSHALNFEIVRNRVDDLVLVTDEEMLAAARRLWFEAGIAAELSGAAAYAALLAGKIPLAGVRTVCAVVCGAGTDGLAA